MYTVVITSLLLGIFRFVDCQCDGSVTQINSGKALFESPNYPAEYRKAASCAWNFSGPSGNANYILQFTVVTMKLYFEDDMNARYCSGSYNLTIDDDLLDCTRLVVNSEETHFCIAFNSSCTSKSSQCESVQSMPTNVEVTYESDGREVEDGNQTIWGFRIEYEFIQCESTPTGTTVPAPVTTVQTTEDTSTTTQRGPTSRETTTPSLTDGTSTAAPLLTSASENSRPGPGATSRGIVNTRPSIPPGTTTTPPPTSSDASLAIGLGVAFGILFLVAIAVVGYCCWKRKRAARPKTSMPFSRTRDEYEGVYENDTMPRKPNKPQMLPMGRTSLVKDPMAVDQESNDGYEGDGYDQDDYPARNQSNNGYVNDTITQDHGAQEDGRSGYEQSGYKEFDDLPPIPTEEPISHTQPAVLKETSNIPRESQNSSGSGYEQTGYNEYESRLPSSPTDAPVPTNQPVTEIRQDSLKSSRSGYEQSGYDEDSSLPQSPEKPPTPPDEPVYAYITETPKIGSDLTYGYEPTGHSDDVLL